MAQRYNNYYIYRPGINAGANRQKSSSVGRESMQRFFLVVWLLLLSFGIYFAYSKHTQAITEQRDATIAKTAKRAQDQQQFASAVQEILDKSAGVTYSVAAVDIASGSAVKIGSGRAMNAASCGKILTAVLFLHEAENGKADLSATLGGRTAKYQLHQMIQKSDDNAWALFNNKLTHPALAAYARKIGISSYNPDTNSISAQDMSALLQKLYSGELLSKGYTELLLSYMQNTNYEQFVVPAVPAGYELYHKVGFVDGEINDTAIIDSGGKKAIALSIFSSGKDMSDQKARAQTMQQITQAALNLL
jgi:beta-lactamase class A